jgi:hypothetical protein
MPASGVRRELLPAGAVGEHGDTMTTPTRDRKYDRTRGDLIADLADHVNDLTQIRHHAEIREVTETIGDKRKRVRKRHIITMPSLLESLAIAMSPATTGDTTAAGYESRPPAALEPINVMLLIRTESNVWCSVLDVRRATLSQRLSALVGAAHTDTQLALLEREAAAWVRKAKLATGWEAESFTLNQPCPNCFRKHCLTITGDLQYANCSRCSMSWDPNTIGLLTQMLTVNETYETLAVTTCNDRGECYLASGHVEEHRNSTGRHWPQEEMA